MSGLFVQKHVEALRTQGCEARVICSQGWQDTWRQWKALRREGWMPEVVQLNVIQKQGALALWLKRTYGIPFIIVEHWSGYLPENGIYRHMSLIKRRFMERVCREAEVVLAVSQRLQDAMKDCGLEAKQWGLIDNVVDEFFYKQSDFHRQPSEIKTLLHVSCFDEQSKNVKGLLRAAKMLSEKRKDWRLVLVGTGVDYADVQAYAQDITIPNDVLLWTGELTPQEVAVWMQQSDALVLSSRYETYGVVLAEAYAAGLPILSTPVGIAEDIATLIVPQEIAQNKAGRFAEFIESVLWNTDRFATSVQNTDRFSGKSIGKKLRAYYDSCLHRDI